MLLSIKAPNGLKALSRENQFTVTFAGQSLSFGLVCASRMKLFGPYWDNYDTTLYQQDPYQERTQRFPNGDGDIHAMFNGFVNIDREYIPEDFSQLPNGGQWVNIHGSEFDLERYISYRGPACVYLIHEFQLEHAVPNGQFHFGCNAPAKVWINGQLVLVNHQHFAWTIFNCTIPAQLKEGKNQIVYKLTRTDRFQFSAICRDIDNRSRFLCNITSVEK